MFQVSSLNRNRVCSCFWVNPSSHLVWVVTSSNLPDPTFFFFNDPPPTKIYPLPQPAPLPINPKYAAAHGFIAWCHEQRYLRDGLHGETREAARRHAHAAIEAGADDAMALAMGGFVVGVVERDRKSTRLNSSHQIISYAVFFLK